MLIITFLILKYDIIENSRIELRGIVLPVQMGGLLGGGGGAKGMLAPPLKLLGGAWPPLAPLFLRLCIFHVFVVFLFFALCFIVVQYLCGYVCYRRCTVLYCCLSFFRLVGGFWRCDGAEQSFQCRGRPTNLNKSRARAYCACSRCGWGLFGHFFSRLSFLFSFSLSLGDGPI